MSEPTPHHWVGLPSAPFFVGELAGLSVLYQRPWKTWERCKTCGIYSRSDGAVRQYSDGTSEWLPRGRCKFDAWRCSGRRR